MIRLNFLNRWMHASAMKRILSFNECSVNESYQNLIVKMDIQA